MEIQQIVHNYYPKIFSFLKKYLAKKTREAKKTAPESFYFVKTTCDFVLQRKREIAIEPAVSYFFYKHFGGKEERKFVNIAAALFLISCFCDLHSLTNWKKSAIRSSPFLKNIFKKYEKDETKKDPLHIVFSQSLVLGDIISGFGYEAVINSDFSDEQKVKVLEELNNIIKWRQIAKLAELAGRKEKSRTLQWGYSPYHGIKHGTGYSGKVRDKKRQASREKYLIEGPTKIGAIAAGKKM